MKKAILFIYLLSSISLCQTKDPEVILRNVKEKFEEVKDYVVDVRIKIDVDFLKAPASIAKIYFKAPDKIHLESENFALLPKEGINFSPLSLLKDKHTSIYEREDTLDGIKTSVVKIIPLGENGNIILTTLWIDQNKNVIRKVESTTKANGTFSLEMNYQNSPDDYPLPGSMLFKFNVDKERLTKGMRENMGEEKEEKADENEKTKTGKVFIDYSNYKVNQGLPDSIFEQKKSKKL